MENLIKLTLTMWCQYNSLWSLVGTVVNRTELRLIKCIYNICGLPKVKTLSLCCELVVPLQCRCVY